MSNKNKQSKISRYEILEQVGEGGFGLVYRGHDPLLNRQVAIKVLKSDVGTAPDFVERFRREARLAASLRHPNIVNVIEVGEHEGRFYLVMDLLPGGTLSNLLVTGKPLPIGRAIELLKPIAEALDYAHRKGMIHRDVKPSNVILNEDGQPVLTDFGLGKSLTESGGTTTGLALGTAEYMAPEQILGKDASPATDIYALGVITYQMLTGQLPFSGTTPFTIQKGHAEEAPPDPRQINSALGELVAKILLKSLEKEPSLRFQTGAEFVSSLKKIASLEEKEYWNGFYEEASNLMEQRKFPEALEKWEALQKVHPDYRDVPAQITLCRQRIELVERYTRTAEALKKAQQEAQEILSMDHSFPDDEAVFERLGLREDRSRTKQPANLPPADAERLKTEAHTENKSVKFSKKRKWEEIAGYFVYAVGTLSILAYFVPTFYFGYVSLVQIPLTLFVIALNWENVSNKTNNWGKWLFIFGAIINLIDFLVYISYLGFLGDVMTIIGIYLWNKKV